MSSILFSPILSLNFWIEYLVEVDRGEKKNDRVGQKYKYLHIINKYKNFIYLIWTSIYNEGFTQKINRKIWCFFYVDPLFMLILLIKWMLICWIFVGFWAGEPKIKASNGWISLFLLLSELRTSPYLLFFIFPLVGD